jgi:TRAP-type C4-dicarboxylate transport system permease small subunit
MSFYGVFNSWGEIEHIPPSSLGERMNNATSQMMRLSNWFNRIALVALTIMLGLVTADIIGAKLLGRPVPGAMDLTSLLALIMVGFSTTQTQIMGRHITVDFMTTRLPKSLRKVLRGGSTMLCIFFFLMVIWRLFLYARDLQIHREVSLTVKIPLAPFAYGLALAFIPMVLVLLIQLWRILKGLEE